jgi:Zn-dependent protease with chaperone function
MTWSVAPWALIVNPIKYSRFILRLLLVEVQRLVTELPFFISGTLYFNFITMKMYSAHVLITKAVIYCLLNLLHFMLQSLEKKKKKKKKKKKLPGGMSVTQVSTVANIRPCEAKISDIHIGGVFQITGPRFEPHFDVKIT